MSTDYNYDEQVLKAALCLGHDTDSLTGPVLPLLHPHHLRPCYPPPFLYSPPSEQRFEPRASYNYESKTWNG